MDTLIKNWRSRADLTQAELAQMVGVTQGAVSRWESGGRVDPGRTSHLIAALELSESDAAELRLAIIAQYEASASSFVSAGAAA
jgi:transcriptional regulator with XRE-family HTH domain